MTRASAGLPAPEFSSQPAPWVMPIRPEQYRREPLSQTERTALDLLAGGDCPLNSSARRTAEQVLARLTAPLHAVFALRHSEESHWPLAKKLFYQAMHRRGQAFWQWSEQDWQETIGATATDVGHAHGLRRWEGRCRGLRTYLVDVAYLLGGYSDFGVWWTATTLYPMARVIFGADVLARQIGRIDAVLAREGYATGHSSLKQRHQAIALLLLLNRSPWLDQLSWQVLDRAAEMALPHPASVVRGKVAMALVTLGILAPRVHPEDRDRFPPGPRDGVPDEWYAWYLAWRATGSRGLARRVAHNYGSYILYTGRWLAARHPGLVSPEQWTEETALALRAAVLEETNTIFVSSQGADDLQRRGLLGRRLSHEAISQFLAALRRFFRDVQTKAHSVGSRPPSRLPRAFDPREALATPADIQKALEGSEPRDIAPAIWQRLAIQAARLTREDLGPAPYWPFSAVQAMALLWVSTARRPNELLRLRVDCVREQWEPQMRDEDGDPLPSGGDIVGEDRGTKVAYLHIPSSKYSGPAWVWIPQYTAEALARWRRERGEDRVQHYDHKDRVFTDLLFSHRGKRMGVTFLNRRLIPLLCAKANVDPFDAEGAYTAHRGRSARISLLHACGLELEDLAAYALHKDTKTIKKYARRNPIHLHRKVARADTLSTVIEGLYDPNAARQNAPSVHWFLGYDPDGTPLFCGLPAHHTCPRRLDCPHCGLFIGGERARLLQHDPTLLHVSAEVPMADAQQLLNQGQMAAAERVLADLRTVPTPVPPTVAYLTNPSGLSEAQLMELGELATADALAQLQLVEEDLTQTLAEYRGKDGRNVAVRTLRLRLALVHKLLARCQRREENSHPTVQS